MHKKMVFIGFVSVLLMGVSCRSHYEVTGIQRTRILIDSRYDAAPDAEAEAFLSPYKNKVDSVMSPVVGKSAAYMDAGRPESRLSNLLTDILVWGGMRFDEHPDFGVYNMGGIRAALPKGEITFGDVLDVAPFENKICFLSLTGEKVLELFSQIASRGGEGVSKSVRLRITANGQLLSAQVNGKDIDKKAIYRVVTLDYLAQGNDGLVAFKSKTNMVSPQSNENNVRFVIMDYFREQAAQGKIVDAKVEGRITIE
ncbi:MAG TPA: 5'-nucleotidase [Prevotella sp.]